MSESRQIGFTFMNGAAIALVFLTLMGMVMPIIADDIMDEGVRKLAIHVNSADKMTQGMAIRNAGTVLKLLKPKVIVEFVTYGPGISLVTAGGPNEAKVIGLMDKGVQFHLCDLTVKKMTRKQGKMPTIIEGVNIVTSGTVKIMDLQEAGYTYLKP